MLSRKITARGVATLITRSTPNHEPTARTLRPESPAQHLECCYLTILLCLLREISKIPSLQSSWNEGLLRGAFT